MKVPKTLTPILAALAVGVVALQPKLLLAQPAPSGGWLDQATANWNQPGAALPRSPAPKAASAKSTDNWWTDASSPDGPSIVTTSAEDKQYFERCKSLVRPATLPEDKLVEDAGWVLFGQAHVFGKVTIVTAMAAVDGMCRPSQYQAFVFSDGRFVGSLSPTLMSARTDGALDRIQFIQEAASQQKGAAAMQMVPYASFRRYKASDPLCCPSETSTVMYELANDGGNSVLVPQLPADTSANCSD